MNQITASNVKLIVVTGTAGRASIATMIAALLRARGQHVAQLNGHWLHSPLEQLTVDGKPVDRDSPEALGSTDRAADTHDIDSLLARALQLPGLDWLIMSGAAPHAPEAVMAVLAPVLPSACASASQNAAQLLRDLPKTGLLVSAPQRESVLDVLRPYSAATSNTLLEVAQRCRLARERSDLDGQAFRLKTGAADDRLHLSVLGTFQVENAATAVLAVESLGGEPIDPGSARAALDAVRLPGRAEVLKRRPLIIVDAGSIAGSAGGVVEILREHTAGRRLQVIVDTSEGIEPTEMVRLLTPQQPEIVVTGAPIPSGWGEACREAGLPLRSARDVASAVELAMDAAEPGEAIAVFGSRAAAAAARAQVLALLPPEMRLN
ncbi:MAG TPA: hypothetical protein VK821_06670 [Dehalococcoidia bacterium]|nr:hypothetical protein [Dehalococcoidia bacterium]